MRKLGSATADVVIGASALVDPLLGNRLGSPIALRVVELAERTGGTLITTDLRLRGAPHVQAAEA